MFSSGTSANYEKVTSLHSVVLSATGKLSASCLKSVEINYLHPSSTVGVCSVLE